MLADQELPRAQDLTDRGSAASNAQCSLPESGRHFASTPAVRSTAIYPLAGFDVSLATRMGPPCCQQLGTTPGSA